MTINEEDRSADVLRRQADGSGRRLAALAAAVVTCAKTDVKAFVSAATNAGNASTPKT